MEIVAVSEEGIMKRKNIYGNNHPFTPNPFEAFWGDSWYPVERLKISGGTFSTHIIFDGKIIEEDIPMPHLRVKSRKATLFDCTTYLRQGIDICVICIPGNAENGDDKKDIHPVWIDAKIRSIEREPHDVECTCRFHTSFYIDQSPDILLGDKKLSKETRLLNIDQIYVLQKLDQKPCESNYFRWSFSEDCFSLQKTKLFNGRFLPDISWLLVASVVKQTAFAVRSIRNHVVYEISEHNGEKVEKNPQNDSYVVNFKVDGEILTPIILKFDPEVTDSGNGEDEIGSICSYGFMELRRSKRRIIQPDRYMGCEDLDYDVVVTRLGENKRYRNDVSSDDDEYDDMPLALSVQADDELQKHRGDEDWVRSYKRKMYGSMKLGSSKHPRKEYGTVNKGAEEDQHANIPRVVAAENNSDLDDQDFHNFRFPEHQSKDIGEMVSKYFSMTNSAAPKKNTFDFNFMELESSHRGGGKGSRRHYIKRNSATVSLTKDCVYVRESVYDVRGFRKGSASAQICRELIRRCMINIDETLKNEPKQVPVVDQWKEFQSAKFPNNIEREEKLPEANNEEEISEIDMLWKEMEFALASWFLLDDNEDTDARPIPEVKKSSKKSEHICDHDFRLNEQIGTICRLCGFVETEIKDFLPPFSSTVPWISNKDQTVEEETENKTSELGQFSIPAPSTTPSAEGQGENDVWALIPELGARLRHHQKRAFEFLWRNIAGSLVPSRMEKQKKKRGGCVISHTPGAGKTLLIIAFLVSYLKLFPGSRPLVLAPKTTLYTWYKEIIKWKVPIPVYQIHGGQTYKGEVLKQRIKLAPGLPRNQDVMHVLDCLEKMQKWLSHPSILLMGYTSFLTLTREDSHYAHRKYMAQLLKQCPGILILDEGHNPRSTKSRLRKGLMKVNTRLRVLLSGTLFQNNFGEYFNTLCLARPVFVNEVLRELDPKYEKRNKERQTQYSLENRGRKLLIDKISKKIDSNVGEERAQALKILKKLTSKFIDVYEGGNSDNLPGLQCYTLMMKSTSLQQEILLKLQNQRPVYKGFPLELELLITLGAIHPWLIKTTTCASKSNYFSSDELDELEQYKFDLKSGSKVRFVMNLIPRCIMRNEKVLIFCHNIAPISLFLQIFERFYGWRKGREVLVLQGDIELFERGRVMDKFEEPGGLSKIMLASITACAEGISLTAASRVILLDSEWNPSKSKQAIARAFRPGQNKVVYVYQLLATGTLEEEKHSRTTWKEWVSDMIFSEGIVFPPSLSLSPAPSSINHNNHHPHFQLLDVSAALHQARRVVSGERPAADTQYLQSTHSINSSLSLILRPRSSLRLSAKNYTSLSLSRLARDQARVRSLHSRHSLSLSGLSALDLEPILDPDQLESPVSSGSKQGSGEYFARVGLGQPVKEIYMVIDTGSDISWLQCQPCSDCYQQTGPIFNPSASSTYRKLTCTSQQCSALQVSACRANSCLYQVSYGDGSYTVGDFVTETMSFGGGSVSDVAIGCGHDNEGLFVAADGLLGLGGGSLSLPSQIKASSFSYCLVHRDSSASSTLEFNAPRPNDAVLAPLLRNSLISTYHYVGLAGINVGGQAVNVPESLFQIDGAGKGGVIVDSGTAVTRLRTEAYASVRDAFVSMASQTLPSTTTGFALFDTCYDLSSKTSVSVPTVSFRFAGGQTLRLTPSNYLIPVDDAGKFCFAFAPSSGSLSIIGNVQQQGTRVSYDLANRYVGFSPNKC